MDSGHVQLCTTKYLRVSNISFAMLPCGLVRTFVPGMYSNCQVTLHLQFGNTVLTPCQGNIRSLILSTAVIRLL